LNQDINEQKIELVSQFAKKVREMASGQKMKIAMMETLIMVMDVAQK